MYIKTHAEEPQFYENDAAKEVIHTYFKQYALYLLSSNGEEIDDNLSKYLIEYAIKKLPANNDVRVAYNNLIHMEKDGNTKKIKKKKKSASS